MSSERPFTADDYQRALEEGDRWIEVVAGRLVRLSPPDELHGNVVRNLAKALGAFLRQHPVLYPCFELGLIVARQPDTIRCPAISCFSMADGLAQMGLLVTDRKPELIVEVASSNDRRESMAQRVREYQQWGVPAIWVFDPVSLHAHVFHRGALPQMLKAAETLHGCFELAGFHVSVGEQFADPKWAR
jgi:Uma2 family endonuclease|uniref:Uma2 family endonuclease n=1 Tax=Schlesneria paludicola TaxID=360056 RepID=A0A7C4LK59_9PLAN